MFYGAVFSQLGDLGAMSFKTKIGITLMLKGDDKRIIKAARLVIRPYSIPAANRRRSIALTDRLLFLSRI